MLSLLFDLFLYRFFILPYSIFNFLPLLRTIWYFEDDRWKRKFENVINAGLENINMVYITSNIILPIIIWLLDFFLVPYFISKCLSCFTSSYANQTLLVRYSYYIYLMMRIGIFAGKGVYKELVALHDEMRDSRYLVGTELTNRLINNDSNEEIK